MSEVAKSGRYYDLIDKPVALPNPKPITINGQRYDGSEAVTVTVSGEGGGTPVEIDDTLTQSGKAADAKATGDALNALNQANATQNTEIAKKANDADLAKVAKSGSYNDLTNKPTIPTVPTTLPNPNKLILSGAVTAEYDGSSEVSVEIPAVGGEDWQLITSSDTEVTSDLLELNADNYGNSFALKKAVLFLWVSKKGAFSYVNFGIEKFAWIITVSGSSEGYMYRAEFKKDVDGVWICEVGRAKYNSTTYKPTENLTFATGRRADTTKETITSVFFENGTGCTIAKYALYGIKE